MILTTTPQIEGHPIREYKGLVTGETIIGAKTFSEAVPEVMKESLLRQRKLP